MQAYDFVILFILVVATIWGARRGFAKQLATILSLVLGYFVAVWFREPVSQMIQAPDPWNKFAAMLGLFMATSLAVWICFRFVKGEIEDSGLKGFDTQIGALFGLAKGTIIAMVITMFAAVMLGDAQRHHVLESFSGYNICRLLTRSQAIVPTEWSAYMQRYMDVIEQHHQHLAGEYPQGQQPLGQQPVGQVPTGQPYQPPVANSQQNPFGDSRYAQQPAQQGFPPQQQTQQGSGFGGLFGVRGNSGATQNQQTNSQQQYGSQPQQTGQQTNPFSQIKQDFQRGLQQVGQQAQQAAQQRLQQEAQRKIDQVMQPVQQVFGDPNQFQTPVNQQTNPQAQRPLFSTPN